MGLFDDQVWEFSQIIKQNVSWFSGPNVHRFFFFKKNVLESLKMWVNSVDLNVYRFFFFQEKCSWVFQLDFIIIFYLFMHLFWKFNFVFIWLKPEEESNSCIFLKKVILYIIKFILFFSLPASWYKIKSNKSLWTYDRNTIYGVWHLF